MKYFDSHCHLEEGMIPIIQESETKLVMNIGCDLKSSIESVAWTEAFPWIYGTVGIHPEFANELDDTIERIEKLAIENEKIKAIGEIGLDYHWEDNPPRDVQRRAFIEQIEMAKRIDLPICIHSRDADQETMDILKDTKSFDSIPVLMHCFSGSEEIAKQYIKLGAWISIAGPVTYKNNRKTIEVVSSVPLDRLLIETDSPYLTPEPHRGHSNTPANVKYTAAKVAEIKNLSLEEIAEETFNNACRFYRIRNN